MRKTSQRRFLELFFHLCASERTLRTNDGNASLSSRHVQKLRGKNNVKNLILAELRPCDSARGESYRLMLISE